MQLNSSASLAENQPGFYGQTVQGFRTREAEATIMSVLTVTCDEALTLGYTWYQKASSAFSKAPPIHIVQVGDWLKIRVWKNLASQTHMCLKSFVKI